MVCDKTTLKWMNLGVVQAGLGRTGALIGCYIMKHYRFTCNEVHITQYLRDLPMLLHLCFQLLWVTIVL